MTKSQELQIQQSEARETLSELLDIAASDRTAEETAQIGTLTTEIRNREPEIRAAIAAEPDPQTVTVHHGGANDPEVRERQRMVREGRVGIADFLRAACGGQAVTGAAKEYADAVGVPDIGHLPLQLMEDRRPEVRAITPGPAVDGPVQPAIPFVFQRSDTAALGVQMVMVGGGQVQIPRVSTAVPSDTLAKDADAPVTAAAVSLDTQKPKRIASQFEVRVEDLAVYPELENVLLETMQGAMSNELDGQVVNGTNASGDLNGLFQQATDVTVDGDVEAYISGITRFAELIDGTHAYSLADVRALIGPATYGKFMSVYANNDKGDISLADYLASKVGMFRVSDRIPAAANDGQKILCVLTAGPSPIRLYVWDSMQIVRDPYGGAGAGKVTLTGTTLTSDVYVPHTTAQVKELHPKLA